MAVGERKLKGPDLSIGIPLARLPECRPVVGHLAGEAVLLVRRGDEVQAVGATCTHYGGPLGEGLVVGETIRCPWHHACFSLRTGEAQGAPALNPLPTWEVEVADGLVRVGRRREEASLSNRGRRAAGPDPVVIVGAGAAGSACAEMLRREGHAGRIIVVDPDPDAPCDRPNLSKDYLAGSAPEAWIALRPAGFYEDHGIERVRERALAVDRLRGRVRLESGREIAYGGLLIATGATPRRLNVPGSDLPHVHTLRTVADCRSIIERASAARNVVVAGAGFIGMEAAASLRQRGLAVTVVAPEQVPFERVFGPDLGAELWRVHEENGVEFRLGQTIAVVNADAVVLDDGTVLQADLVLVGVGVRPATALAEEAGLLVDDGVIVDEYLRTMDPRIWVAGDLARWPDARTGERIRVEHWVVAQRQGQAVARSMLGRAEPFREVPFFWTRQFGVGVSYVGHAEAWDDVEDEGDARAGDAEYRYLREGRVLAVATIGRDLASLRAESSMAAEAGAPARVS